MNLERTEKKEEGDLEKGDRQQVESTGDWRIVVDGDTIVVPEWLGLEFEEKALLEMLSTRLREGRGRKESDSTQAVSPSGENRNGA